jgi:hypothetical protein
MHIYFLIFLAVARGRSCGFGFLDFFSVPDTHPHRASQTVIIPTATASEPSILTHSGSLLQSGPPVRSFGAVRSAQEELGIRPRCGDDSRVYLGAINTSEST